MVVVVLSFRSKKMACRLQETRCSTWSGALVGLFRTHSFSLTHTHTTRTHTQFLLIRGYLHTRWQFCSAIAWYAAWCFERRIWQQMIRSCTWGRRPKCCINNNEIEECYTYFPRKFLFEDVSNYRYYHPVQPFAANRQEVVGTTRFPSSIHVRFDTRLDLNMMKCRNVI